MREPITTLDGYSSGLAQGPPARREQLALVVLWSASEPERVGEVAFFAEGRPAVLGRGSPRAEQDAPARAIFHRQRAGLLERTPPLVGSRISRDQLEIHVDGDTLRVRRVGRCPVLVRGETLDACPLRPGDTMVLRDELVLLCTLRSRTPVPLASFPAASLGPFGSPDAFGILGESPAAHRLRESIAWNAQAGEHVLLVGPSGSGKELAARAIHALSNRASGAFVARNAATIPSGLVDAELFGSLRNYPNAGLPERPGLIGQAHGGTLFLDEIAELPEGVQAHLLRVLDGEGEYHRLGESVARRADVRLVGATNRPAESLKHDLAARIPLRIDLPGLDARKEDVPLLAAHLARAARGKSPALTARFFDSKGNPRFAPRLIEHLVAHRFTTHVRELGALLWRAMAASEGEVIDWVEGAEGNVSGDDRPREGGAARAGAAASAPPTAAREPTLAEIREAWAANAGNVSGVARALGLSSRFALYRRMRKLGIALDGWRTDA